jgi:hypothetical protein
LELELDPQGRIWLASNSTVKGKVTLSYVNNKHTISQTKEKEYFDYSIFKVTLVLPGCESTAHCSFWSGEGTFFTQV